MRKNAYCWFLILSCLGISQNSFPNDELPSIALEEKGMDWKAEFIFPASYFSVNGCPNTQEKKKLKETLKKLQKEFIILPNFCVADESLLSPSELLNESCLMTPNEKITVNWSTNWKCKRPLISISIKSLDSSTVQYSVKRRSLSQEGQIGFHRKILDLY